MSSVCVQKNAFSNPSFCSQGKARSATRKAWVESKFDRVAKTLFPIDSRGRAADFLGACVALPAAKSVSWWSAINVTQQTIHPSTYFCINTSPALSVAGLLEPEVGLHSGPKRAQTNQRSPTLGLTLGNSTQEARVGSKCTTFLFWGYSTNKGTNTTTQSAQKKPFPAFLAVVGLVWAQP